jgi:hypothetical protein
MSIQAPSLHGIANVAPAPVDSGRASAVLTGAGDWRLGLDTAAKAQAAPCCELTSRIAAAVIGHSTLQQAAESAMQALSAAAA